MFNLKHEVLLKQGVPLITTTCVPTFQCFWNMLPASQSFKSVFHFTTFVKVDETKYKLYERNPKKNNISDYKNRMKKIFFI